MCVCEFASASVADDVQANISDILLLWEYVEITLCWSPHRAYTPHSQTSCNLSIISSKYVVVGFMGCLAFVAIVNAVVERTNESQNKKSINSVHISCTVDCLLQNNTKKFCFNSIDGCVLVANCCYQRVRFVCQRDIYYSISSV